VFEAETDDAKDSTCKQQLVDLILHMRDISDHVIREGTAPFNTMHPGSLVTEWQPEERKYRFPFALLWAYDEAEQERRSGNQQLATHQKQRIPLLPFWTFGVTGDGSCTLHSILAQVRVDGTSSMRHDVATIVKLPRTLWGTMRGEHLQLLKEKLKSYADRSDSISSHTHAKRQSCVHVICSS